MARTNIRTGVYASRDSTTYNGTKKQLKTRNEVSCVFMQYILVAYACLLDTSRVTITPCARGMRRVQDGCRRRRVRLSPPRIARTLLVPRAGSINVGATCRMFFCGAYLPGVEVLLGRHSDKLKPVKSYDEYTGREHILSYVFGTNRRIKITLNS